MEQCPVTVTGESELPHGDSNAEPSCVAVSAGPGGGEAESCVAPATGSERVSRRVEGGRGRRGRHSGRKEGVGGVRRGAHHLAAKFRGCRKRAYSFPSISKFFLPHKRPRKETFIPPTKFLLGGNISDPLNLNSLQDEDVNRAMNAVTPESSPLPTPPRHKAKVDVIIPPDFRDPLNLLHPLSDDEYEKRLEAQRGRRPRKRTKTRRRASESGVPAHTDVASPPRSGPAEPPVAPSLPPAPEPPPVELEARTAKRSVSESEGTTTKPKDSKKLRRMDSLDKIVSPVVPQPGAWMRARPPARHDRPAPASPRRHAPVGANIQQALPKFDPKNERFQYGNYDRYYGYRNLNAAMDVRLQVFQLHRHLFHNKDVLDVGCNVGHVSIAAARELGARSVTGIDIDHTLIARARQHLRTYVSVPTEPQDTDAGGRCPTCVSGACEQCSKCSGKRNKHKQKRKKNRKQQSGKFYFPASFSLLYGPIELPGEASSHEPRPFPHNVTFKQGNYVLKEESLVGAVTAQYDLILCLSTTKWLHLNWGDAGLKLAFRRMFAELRPGGKLILEVQGWASYKKKKRLTPQIYNNYNTIELLPSKFRDYLLSPEVGFSKCCVLGVPQHASKGFRRPVQLYVKGDFTPSKAQWSDAYAPPSSHHRPDAPPPRRTVYAAALSPSPRPPSCGAATPYSPAPHLDCCVERSPFYTPRSDSYAPSYTQEPAARVYAAFPSPLPGADSPAASPAVSPAAPFLEPSPGHSHACTPSHSSSASIAPHPARPQHKYALRSPVPLSSPVPDESSLD